MTVTTSQLVSEFSPQGLVSEAVGEERSFQRITAVEDCGPGDLVFADHKDYVAAIRERRPSVVVAPPPLKESLSGLPDTTLLIAPQLKLAHALIKQKYGGRRLADAGWPRIHPSAVVHETAVVSPTACVEPCAVIGRNARVGDRSWILAGAVIEHDARIGNDTVVHPNAVVGYGCIVGNDAVIGAGSVIGSEGYGFAQDRRGKSHPIPQTGIVELGDRVRLGANCCIDRAAYRTTRIGAGTKIDNLCHIAHNVTVGEDCLLTSMLCVAGSSQIGNRVMTSGQTGILDHVTICDDVALVHRAGVTKDITKPGAYGGGPVQPLNEYMRNTAAARQPADLRQRVLELERKAGVGAGSAGEPATSP
jgi:UDP-3-O-[3-hydroxymyristoyl] glucosamine N-acyltransferase